MFGITADIVSPRPVAHTLHTMIALLTQTSSTSVPVTDSNALSKVGEQLSSAASHTAAETWILVLAALVLIGLLIGRLVRHNESPLAHRTVDEHPWWLYLACAFATFVALSIGPSLAATLGLFRGDPPESYRLLVATQLCGSLVGALIGLLLVRLVVASASSSGLDLKLGDLPRGLLCFAIAIPVVLASGIIASSVQRAIGGTIDTLAHPLLTKMADHQNDPWTLALIAHAVVLAPIAEEIIFRGFLQSAALRLVKRAWLAATISAVLFAAIHIGTGDTAIPWYAIVPIFVLGLANALAFERTGRLGVPVVMHMAFNLANILIARNA